MARKNARIDSHILDLFFEGRLNPMTKLPKDATPAEVHAWFKAQEHRTLAIAARRRAHYDAEEAGVAEYHDAEVARLEAELAAGRGRAGRRRKNPIPPRDEAFLLDPFEFVAGTVLEDYCPEVDAGFFHVTTRGKKVFDEGRLRSRKDVGVVGLGGGLNDPGKHVSVVINFDRALWLYNAIKGLSEAANNGTAVDVLRLVLDWTGFPDSEWSYSLDTEDEGPLEDLGQMAVEIGLDPPSDLAELTSRAGWDDLISAQGEQLNEEHRTPRQRYKLAQFIEDRLESTFYFPEDWDDGTCVPLVGFTAEASDFVRSVDPEDVTIVQVALRGTTGRVEEIPRECELRLPPDHIRIVAVGCENGERISVPSRDGERENPTRAFDDAHADEVDDWVTIEECGCHTCAPARMNPRAAKRTATGAYADLDSVTLVITNALANYGLSMNNILAVKFTRGGKSRGGACSYSRSLKKCQIMFNGLAWPAFTEAQRLNTVLHEAAHAIQFLTTGTSDHGPKWQQIAQSIGCSGDSCMSLEASQAMVDAYAEAKGLEKRKIITREDAEAARADFAVGDYVSFDHKRERWFGKIVSRGPMHATVMIQSPREGITGKIPYPSLQKEAPPRFAEKVAGVDKPAPGESITAWQARTGRGVR